ncbi:unnamed protein product [Paramecium sonneborni]|uniref:Transmembrane protein n=1 Tax=Paramecium sonneborni TaxID=65129 RepID=A0A8S1NRG4_9CILI|nr:unnamed protein product [Paramecium sonneborni]
MNKKNKNAKKESNQQVQDQQSQMNSLASLDISKKIIFLKKILWTWLIWQSVIVLSCFVIYIEPPFLSVLLELFDSDLLLMFFVSLTIVLLYFGSSNINQIEEKRAQIYLISIIITQTLLYSQITSKLNQTNSINFILIHCMLLIVIGNLLLHFRIVREINHQIYFKQMIQYCGLLIAAEFFFTKTTSINTLQGIIVIVSILGFGTFTLRSIESLTDGKFNLKEEQVYLGCVVAYTNLLLPNRKFE